MVQGIIKEFTAKIQELTDRIDTLEKQLAKNSHNSSKPPYSDGLSKKKKRTRSMRKRSGKKNGGQKGHLGKTLNMSENPDNKVKIKVKKCQCCGKSLQGIKPKDYDKRQKFEIPQIEVMVTEYQSEIKDCPDCGKENRALFPEGITHKIQYGNYLRSIAIYFRNYELLPSERTAEIFEDIFSIPLSEGTLYNISKRFAEGLTKQLWYAAQLYYSLLPRNIDKNEMAKTVGQWSNECEISDDFYMTPLFTYSCHLASCAIRLYSIDEKKNYKRYSDYQDWWINKQKGGRLFTINDTGRIIHCVLRNLVAHDEEKCKNTTKRSYEELKKIL